MADVLISVVPFLTRTTTGTLDIVSDGTGGTKNLAGKPIKAVLIFGGAAADNDTVETVDARGSIGFAANGGNQRCFTGASADNLTSTDTWTRWLNDAVLRAGNSTSFIRAGVSAWITNGVRLNFTAVLASARRYVAVFFAGDDVQAYVDSLTMTSTVDPLIAVTSVGFQPDAVLFAHTGAAATVDSNNNIFGLGFGAATSNGDQACITIKESDAVASGGRPTQLFYDTACIAFQSAGAGAFGWSAFAQDFDANGFDLDITGTTTANEEIGYLALSFGGAAYTLESFVAPTSTGTEAKTGFGFVPQFGLIAASSRTTANDIGFDVASCASVGFGAFDDSLARTQSLRINNAADPTDTAEIASNAAFSVGSNTALNATRAALSSFDADGWTLNFSAVSGSATRYWALAVEEGDVVAISPMRATQSGISMLSMGDADLRTTQLGLLELSKQTALTRVTQMGLLMLARGAAGLLVPDPLALTDRGRSMVIRQRLVNMYSEPTPQGPSESARFGRPGLYEAETRGDGPIRAIFTWKYGMRVTVSGEEVYINDFPVGTIPNVDDMPVRWAVSDDECVIVSNGRAYYVTVYEVTIIENENLLNVIDVKFLAGRFVYVLGDRSGRYFYSNSGDALTISGLSFISAESNPDPINACERQGDALVFYGERSTEFHYATSDPAAPFQRSSGRSYDKGSNSPHSIVSCDNTLVFLGSDRRIYRSESVPMVISNEDVADRCRRVTDANLPKVTSFTVNFGNHEWYVINLPDQGTWAYDFSQRVWAEWRSWNKPRFRVNCADKNVLGDIYSGKLLGMDGQKFTDLDDPLERVCSTFARLKSGTLKNFNLTLMCKRGVGLATGHGSDPQVEMRFSDNQDGDWSDWLSAPLGVLGDRTRASLALWIKLGSMVAPGRQFEFRCTQPVEFIPYEVKFNEVRP